MCDTASCSLVSPSKFVGADASLLYISEPPLSPPPQLYTYPITHTVCIYNTLTRPLWLARSVVNSRQRLPATPPRFASPVTVHSASRPSAVRTDCQNTTTAPLCRIADSRLSSGIRTSWRASGL